MKQQQDFREWILFNYDNGLKDLIDGLVVKQGNNFNWKDEDIDELLDIIHLELKPALLNIADSYEEPMLKPCGYSGMKTNGGARCPACGAKLQTNTYLIKQKYCHDCGQKLDWDIK